MSNNKKNPYWKANEKPMNEENKTIADIPTEEIVTMAQEAVAQIIVPEPESTDIPEKVRIVWDSVDVRYGDSEQYMAIGTVTKGREYPVVTISTETGWYALRIPGYILWVPPESVEPC